MNSKVKHCPACLSNKVRTVVVADEEALRRYFAFSDRKYNSLLDGWLKDLDLAIDACEECYHHWYRDQPSPEMLSIMYASGRPLKLGNHEILNRSATPKMLAEMRRLRKLVDNKSPRLLDYGSGFGRWARAGVCEGFDVTAYEPSSERGDEAKEVGFKLVHNKEELKGNFFDVINLEQVLEHVPEPYVVVKELEQYCTKNTIVRITVPNILRCPEGDALWNEWPFDGQRAHTMAPFEHLHGFTPNSLRAVAARAGLVPVTGIGVTKNYPIEVARSVIGRMIPSLGQTLLIARCSS